MKEYTYTVREYDMEDYEAARDSMTLDDVVKYLAYVKRGYVPDYNFTGNEDDFERYLLHTAICKAIEIVKKAKSEASELH